MKHVLITVGTGIACLATGGLIGSAIGKRAVRRKTNYCGNLRIDRSEPDEPPKLFIELEQDPTTLIDSTDVIFRVVKKDYLSQS